MRKGRHTDIDIEAQLQMLRAKRNKNAATNAAGLVESAIRQFKGGRHNMGFTNVSEDIAALRKILECLTMGLGVAIDTDADPVLVLKSETWKRFSHDFPEVIQNLIGPETEKRLCTKARDEAQRQAILHTQMEAWFGLAKEALEKALLIQIHSPLGSLDPQGPVR